MLMRWMCRGVESKTDGESLVNTNQVTRVQIKRLID